MSEKIIAYKAMDKSMMCRGKQYEVGKTYNEDKADCCHAGMHACENPLDVLHYYPLKDSPRFFEVECGGDVDKSRGDSKLACTELTVKGEVNFAGLVKATVNAVFDRVKGKEPFSSGNYSTAAATGSRCRAKVDGKDSIAVANGHGSKARGALGCYLVLTEYDDNGHMLCAKMARVDGSTVKEDVWYTLKNGEFVESET
nr:MAG TPA: hypothetical protein [Caudoviricetes sp.]